MVQKINQSSILTVSLNTHNVDHHVSKIAFTISTLALLILSALSLLLGTAVGFIISTALKLKVKPADSILTIQHTVIVIVGAFAALISLTPGGAAGGLVFRSIPFLCSLAIGNTLYRGHEKI